MPHYAMVEEPAHHRTAQAAGQVIPDQDESERRKGSRGSWPSQVAQRAASGRSASDRVTAGSKARIIESSAWSLGWRMELGALLTPLAHTSPMAGRKSVKSVKSLAVPSLCVSTGS
jgi:hypothetical protein